jgi:hypothetical protein
MERLRGWLVRFSEHPSFQPIIGLALFIVLFVIGWVFLRTH